METNEIAEILDRPISQELLARDMTRLAYVAKDGTPRNIPIMFAWNDSTVVMCTPKNAPKLHALSVNPAVALTIDTEVHPPKILLIRGLAELDHVDGIPRRIVVTPTWVKLIDFETTLPSPVEELIQQRAERERA